MNTLKIPQKAMAQTSHPEAAKVLVDDVIQALKSNDTSRAQIHLSILNQQLPTLANSTSLQSAKVLLDDVSSALKNNDINCALVHLNLVEQQLGSKIKNTVTSPYLNTNTANNLVGEINA
jgi:hypothetical protein